MVGQHIDPVDDGRVQDHGPDQVTVRREIGRLQADGTAHGPAKEDNFLGAAGQGELDGGLHIMPFRGSQPVPAVLG